MNKIKWSKEEERFLIENYENSEKKKLLDGLPLRSWDSIKLKSNQLKIKRYYNERRFANLDCLILDNNEIYYWIGFIMADGHIENNRLKIKLSNKDRNHLEKFRKLINFKKELTDSITDGHNMVEIECQDTKYVKILCEKFNIRKNKTHYPCDISNIKNKDLLLSLIIGFIDGDGSIRKMNNRKDFNLILGNIHSSWFHNLEYMLKSIYDDVEEKCNIEVNLKDYASFTISRTSVLQKLKKRVLELKIPYLERKWDIIDLNYVTFYEKSKNKKEKFKILVQKNPKIKVSELCKELNLGITTIYKYKKDYFREK